MAFVFICAIYWLVALAREVSGIHFLLLCLDLARNISSWFGSDLPRWYFPHPSSYRNYHPQPISQDNCSVSPQVDIGLSMQFAWNTSSHLLHQLIQSTRASPRCNVKLNHSATMSHQCNTPHWGSSGRGQAQQGSSLRQEDGYNIGVSMLVNTLINEWESRLVIEHLARGIRGRHLNHYWIVKNMMGSLMENG